ncbi:hypothetical protein P280DRAFT_470568 [Massarina eburnea CBS 473.64]|uniref:Cell death in tomato 1 n=1 Tax=Massarina eburnea CBS 473.64 TaxID=1395130 RepID=A0A6A6RXL6_9PLEO|nr:hypothetical protein P280DRAFT_470568 [Massarina eburnea CBS 473.64]
MLFPTTLTAAIALASTALAAPTLAPRDDTLTPWNLTRAIISTPSGRPGERLWATITVNVTDSNTLNLGTGTDGVAVTAGPSEGLNCKATFLPTEGPWNRSWPCDPNGKQEGYWTMNLKEAPAEGTFRAGYELVLKHVADVPYNGARFHKEYEGSLLLRVGEYLTGTCGGSGACSWGLKAAMEVRQSEIPSDA